MSHPNLVAPFPQYTIHTVIYIFLGTRTAPIFLEPSFLVSKKLHENMRIFWSPTTLYSMPCAHNPARLFDHLPESLLSFITINAHRCEDRSRFQQ